MFNDSFVKEEGNIFILKCTRSGQRMFLQFDPFKM